jgi:hypothetical protein
MESIAALGRRPFIVAALLVCMLTSGCLWWRYESMAETHAGLLVQFSSDAGDLAEAGLEVGDRYLSSLEYPLVRAEQFAESAASLPGSRPSLEALGLLVERYRELFAAMEGLRARAPGPEEAAVVREKVTRVSRAGQTFDAALAAE